MSLSEDYTVRAISKEVLQAAGSERWRDRERERERKKFREG